MRHSINPNAILGEAYVLAPMAGGAGGPTVVQNEGNKPTTAGGVIPFRRATTPRTAIITPTAGTVSAVQQPIQIVVEGTGYMIGINLSVHIETAANAAAVAYQEDAPWNALTSVILSDVTGELVNTDGYGLYLQNVYGGWGTATSLTAQSTDTKVFEKLAGAVGRGGSVQAHLRVPVAIRTRDYLGAVGNQDRSIKYQLRTDFNTTAGLYSVAPTTPGALSINRTYESITVPGPVNAVGIPQQTEPPNHGVLAFWTQSRSPSDPVGGSTVNHYISRLGNTIRMWVLQLRSNGSRATAELNMPSRIQLLLGDTNIFTEDTFYRRRVMYDRYGFDVVASGTQGCLVYDFALDILPLVGGEAGLDWLWSNGLANAQFQITYPAGFGAANNSLIIYTHDLIVPDDVDIYAAA
jgi:hypothetical protein